MKLLLEHPPVPENAPLFAETVVRLAKEINNLDLDYSPRTLSAVDSVLQGWHDYYAARGGDIDEVRPAIFRFGCYAGEVMIRSCGGVWVDGQDQSLGPLCGGFMCVRLPNDLIANPINKAFKEVENGEVDSLAYFYHVFTKR